MSACCFICAPQARRQELHTAAWASMKSCKAICIDSAVTDDCSGIAQRAEVAELANVYPADRYCQNDFALQFDLAYTLALGHPLGRPKQMDFGPQHGALIVYHMSARLLLSTLSP